MWPGRLRRFAGPGLALVAGLAVVAVASMVFPHLSANHDEGVYLQQAEMLLSGQFQLTSDVPEAVRPWFFVQDGPRLYPKYSPVAAAVFALGMAVGDATVSLAVVASVNATLLWLLVREAYDESTALLAVGVLVASPLFLFTSATFLSYAPTTALNLTFAVAYVRALRRRSLRYAALAGAAVGLAFFSRPYTAVLFASPFVVLSVVRVAGTLARDRRRSAVPLHATVAALGVVGVALALAYNAVVTGDPLRFPYQAFAPQDGIGFGHREILGHARDYTPALALRANARVLWQFVANWSAVPPMGPLLAVVGVAVLGRDWWNAIRSGAAGRSGAGAGTEPPSDLTLRLLLAGVAVAVVVGNVAFWGTLNVLGSLSDPTDGLIALLGPYYHFDLLVPFSAFAAAGATWTWRRLRTGLDGVASPVAARRVALVVLVLAAPVAATLEADALRAPAERNAEFTERYEQAYEPFADRSFSDALVFVPTPYGDWLNHPFQSLRNDPSLDGDVVYALDRGPDGNAAVLDAYPDRRLYRYTYRGEWTANPEPVTATLERLTVREAGRHRTTSRFGRIPGTTSASVRLAADGRVATYDVSGPEGESLAVTWTLNRTHARIDPAVLRSQNATAVHGRSGSASVPLDGPTDVTLAVTFVQTGGATVTYRQEVTALPTEDGTRVLWPPVTRVCRLAPDCGYDGTYLQGADDYVTGVRVDTSITSEDLTGDAPRVRP